MMNTDNKWFESWFDTKYYQMLYAGRNEAEAGMFITNLLSKLKLKPQSRIWDLACGSGRHSIFLAKNNFNVIGTDLCTKCLEEAKKNNCENLEFYKLDMRAPFRINYFDAVLNLFTSFGYFDKRSDDLKVFKSVYNSLNENGLFVFDYFNAEVILKEMKQKETKKINEVTFEITKVISNGRIIKKIHITDGEKISNYSESVAIFDLSDILNYAKKAGFKFIEAFGNYNLDPFEKLSSPRMIVLMQKVK